MIVSFDILVSEWGREEDRGIKNKKAEKEAFLIFAEIPASKQIKKRKKTINKSLENQNSQLKWIWTSRCQIWLSCSFNWVWGPAHVSKERGQSVLLPVGMTWPITFGPNPNTWRVSVSERLLADGQERMWGI